ncbi:MAG: hypothetical protein IPF44_12955 [Betaproteobacteria bacterium]|nr:hypothetical protein [Betaproteobacteria bacterium]
MAAFLQKAGSNLANAFVTSERLSPGAVGHFQIAPFEQEEDEFRHRIKYTSPVLKMKVAQQLLSQAAPTPNATGNVHADPDAA